jgi:hypothetical protein
MKKINPKSTFALIISLLLLFLLLPACSTALYEKMLESTESKKREEQEEYQKYLQQKSSPQTPSTSVSSNEELASEPATTESQTVQREQSQAINLSPPSSIRTTTPSKNKETHKNPPPKEVNRVNKWITYQTFTLPDEADRYQTGILNVFGNEIAITAKYQESVYNHNIPYQTVIYFFQINQINNYEKFILDADYSNVVLFPDKILYLEKQSKNIRIRERTGSNLAKTEITFNLPTGFPVVKIDKHPNLPNHILLIRDDRVVHRDRKAIIIDSVNLETYKTTAFHIGNGRNFKFFFDHERRKRDAGSIFYRKPLSIFSFDKRPTILKGQERYIDLSNTDRSFIGYRHSQLEHRVISLSYGSSDYFFRYNRDTDDIIHLNYFHERETYIATISESLYSEPIANFEFARNRNNFDPIKEKIVSSYITENNIIASISGRYVNVIQIHDHALLKQAQKDFILVKSHPPPLNFQEDAWKYQIRVLSKAAASFKLLKGPPAANISKSGELIWRHNKKLDVQGLYKFVVQIESGDLSKTYSFEL